MKGRFILFLTILLAVNGCQNKPAVNFDSVQQYLTDKLQTTMDELQLVVNADSPESMRIHFVKARQSFKAAEPFAQYFNSDNVHKINGPPLPIYREDNGKVLEPVSLQALDEQIFGDEDLDTLLLANRIEILTGYLNNVKQTVEAREITPKRFFVPIHLQFLRIFSLSTISFDTPSSFQGLDDAIISLESIREVYTMAISDTLKSIRPELHAAFLENINEAVDYITLNNDFESFNRYEFGRKHLNNLTSNWVEIRQATGLFEDPKIYAVNLDAPTFFEENSMNVTKFRSSTNRSPSPAQIAVGEELFFDKRLSASGNLSCASCHNPSKAYQDGLVTGIDKEGNPLKRNTPTLINSIFQKKFFWDGRSDNIEQQISVVFETEEEFDHAGHSISMDVLEDPYYLQKLTAAYGKEQPTRNEIVKSLASYTSTLNSFNSRFDKNMRGESSDFTQEEIRGMNLFMGKAVCATCHFIPLTNGTVPPAFAETEKEILGTPETSQNLEVDSDIGFYWVFQEDIHKYMFKTPTIRNIEYTAPYMHNGVYASLEEVMDFYNQGGGGGMGFDLPHQTLPFDSLGLREDEIKSIITFMKTFSDTTIVSGKYYSKDNLANAEMD